MSGNIQNTLAQHSPDSGKVMSKIERRRKKEQARRELEERLAREEQEELEAERAEAQQQGRSGSAQQEAANSQRQLSVSTASAQEAQTEARQNQNERDQNGDSSKETETDEIFVYLLKAYEPTSREDVDFIPMRMVGSNPVSLLLPVASIPALIHTIAAAYNRLEDIGARIKVETTTE